MKIRRFIFVVEVYYLRILNFHFIHFIFIIMPKSCNVFPLLPISRLVWKIFELLFFIFFLNSTCLFDQHITLAASAWYKAACMAAYCVSVAQIEKNQMTEIKERKSLLRSEQHSPSNSINANSEASWWTIEVSHHDLY